jgi:plasmid stabilization system protein ParE
MKIVFSTRAIENFKKIVTYLKFEWGQNSIIKFKYRTEDFLKILERFKEIVNNYPLLHQ